MRQVGTVGVGYCFHSASSLSRRARLGAFVLRARVCTVYGVKCVFAGGDAVFVYSFLLVFSVALEGRFGIAHVKCRSARNMMVSNVSIYLDVGSIHFGSVR